MKIRLPASAGKRGLLTLGLVLLLVAVLLALNLLFPFLALRNTSVIDLTPEGMYTMTDALRQELSDLPEDVEIIFCTDPDYLMASDTTRYPYVTCKKLAADNPRISLSHINVLTDPNAADDFKSTQVSEISWDDIVFRSGKNYRVLAAEAMFGTDPDDNDALVSYNGEYRIASVILSLTAYPNGGCAYFAVGHGERYYKEGDAGCDPSLSRFAELLGGLGFRVDTVDLDAVDTVPADCALLILCGTTADYADGAAHDHFSLSPIEKIDRYLAGHRSMMVFRDALSAPLPTLDNYLEEWGFRIGQTKVISPEHSLVSSDGEPGEKLIAVYPDEETSAIGYSMFSSVVDLAAAPKTVLPGCASVTLTRRDSFVSEGQKLSRNVSAVFYAGADARVYDKDGYAVDYGDVCPIAAVGAEARLGSDGEYRFAYVFGSGSTALIENDYLGDGALGNADVIYSVARTLASVANFASSDLGGLDINSDTYGGKWFAETALRQEDTDYHSDYRYTCSACGWNYRVEKGYEKAGIAAGTQWKNVPEGFTCPHCGEAKSQFFYNYNTSVRRGLSTGRQVSLVILFAVPVAAFAAAGIIVMRRRKNR